MVGSVESPQSPPTRTTRLALAPPPRPSIWLLLISLAVLGALLGSSSFSSWTTPQTVAATDAVTGATASVAATSLATDQLQAAATSLNEGQGPAGQEHLSCNTTPTSALASVQCNQIASSSLPSIDWSPVGSPTGRSAVSMVYDAADGYVVLFANGVDSDVQGDTWIFSQGTWTELNTPVAPETRLGEFMAYDSADNYVVMFGGWGGDNGGPGEYGDTWTFSGGQWHLLIPQSACTGNSGAEPCPSPRDSGGMAMDPSDGYLILFGDYSADEDTWGFANGNWVQLIAATSCTQQGGSTTCPNGTGDESFAWDPALGEDVLFGGYPYSNDTWGFSSLTWTELVAPSSCTGPSGPNPCPAAREESAMTYDSEDGYLVLFGGYNGSEDFDDTWAFTGTWQEVASASNCRTCPTGRSDSGLVDDPALGSVLMFGGYAYLGDTWSYSAGTWNPVHLSGTPGARWDASFAWDPLASDILLFGGFDGTSLGDTWTFANGVWTEIDSSVSCTVSTCPTARLGAGLAWDGTDDYMVLFGGMTPTGGYDRDTWYFSHGTWTEIMAGGSCTATTCPSARSNASMVWDAQDDEVILFGGYGGAYENDTWAFSAGSWKEVLASTACTTLAPCPSPRELAGVAQAPLPTGGVLLFGGATASGNTNDTWTFKGGAWTDVLSNTQCKAQTSICPSTREGAAVSFDPALNLVALFGGWTTHGVDDSWVFSGGIWTKESIYGASDRGYASMAYDGTSGNLILVGGYSPYGLLPDVWALGLSINVAQPTTSPSTPDVGQTVTFSDSISGGGFTTYTVDWIGLPTGCSPPNGSAFTFSCTVTAPGLYYITTVAIPSDGLAGVTSPDFLDLYVNPDPAVTIVSNATSATLGQNISLEAVAMGGTGTYTQFNWFGLPAGCSAPLGANVTCNLANDSDLGSWQIAVSAMDSAGFNVTSQSFDLVVSLPVWSVGVTLGGSPIDLGAYANFGSFITGVSGTFNYTWNNLPSGCSGARPTLLCPPNAEGTYLVTLTVTSTLYGSQTSAPVNLVVNPALGITELDVSSATVSQGSPLTLSAVANGGTAPYDYSWGSLPDGCLALDQAVLTCVPTTVGSFAPTVTVSDATGSRSPAATGSVTVVAPSVGSVVVSASTTSLDLGGSTTLTATLVGTAGTPTVTWTGLPAGCTGSGLTFSCSPTEPGSYFVVADAAFTSGGTLVSNVVELQVAAKLGTVTVQLSSTTATVGQMVTLSAAISGGMAPYTYTWSGLPAGCPAGNTPQVVCEPTAEGTAMISLTVTDASGASGTGAATLAVIPAPAAAPAGFATNASGLDWTVLLLVLVAVVIGLLSLLMSFRRQSGERPPPRPPTEFSPAPSAYTPPPKAASPSGPANPPPPASNPPSGLMAPARSGYVARPLGNGAVTRSPGIAADFPPLS